MNIKSIYAMIKYFKSYIAVIVLCFFFRCFIFNSTILKPKLQLPFLANFQIAFIFAGRNYFLLGTYERKALQYVLLRLRGIAEEVVMGIGNTMCTAPSLVLYSCCFLPLSYW